MTLQSALQQCREALTVVDEAAIDAPAIRLLDQLGHSVPSPFESHRRKFIEVLADASYVEGDEPKVRAVIARFAAQAGSDRLAFDNAAWGERGDEWTGVPNPRRWLVHGWLPAGRIALLAGDGGAGKSRLALQLSAAIARGESDWLPGGPKHAVECASVAVFATYEDEADHVRSVLHATGVQEAVGNRLRYLSPPGALWAPDPKGSRQTAAGVLTPEGAILRAYCEAREARLLVVDPTAGAYALNENDRSLVRGFLSHWDRWARSCGCSVLFISHPPKSAAEYSGSTDWHAACRAVWTLGVAETGMGEETSEGRPAKRKGAPAPRLKCVKSSYARRPEPHWLSGYPAWSVCKPDRAARAWARVCATGKDAPGPSLDALSESARLMG